MNISKTLTPAPLRAPQSQTQTPPKEQQPPSEGDGDKAEINWEPIRNTGAIAAAFVGVPAAATLIGQAVGRPEIGLIGVLGGAVTALALRPKEGSLITATMMGSLGFHGANSFGVAGAVGATVVGGAFGGLVAYQAQRDGTKVF